MLKAITSGEKFSLSNYKSDNTSPFEDKEKATASLAQSTERLIKLQYRLYARSQAAVLVVLQGMDTSGKDGVIQNVLAGLNPQGVEITSFKAPSTEEREHDFLWRHHKAAPRKGRLGVFNRSHYEEVLVARVHPEFIVAQRLPGIQKPGDIGEVFWKARYLRILDFEKLLAESGTTVVKFFLHLSKDEQRRRFLQRLDDTKKQWKFSAADIEERQYWDAYQIAYEKAIAATAAPFAPWYIAPADKKWATRALIAATLVTALEKIDGEIGANPNNTPEKIAEFKRRLANEA